MRFGKTLIILEVDGVEPILFPLLRGDLISQGPRYVVNVGDKVGAVQKELPKYSRLSLWLMS